MTRNPFRYGNPVPPDRFIGREDVVRTLFSRIYNGESTAIVGEPHIGKSSTLRYITHESIYQRWLNKADVINTFVVVDCHLLPESFRPPDIWEQILSHTETAFADPAIQTQFDDVRRSNFGSFRLKRLFEMLNQQSQRVVLLFDEFDALLHNPNFNTAEFFGVLRSLAVHAGSLAQITFSRMPVSEMNRHSHPINPHASPFFNHLIELRLPPLSSPEINQLIDQALEGSGVRFEPKERGYLSRVSGRHPFLLQIACAALFDAITQGASTRQRRIEIDRKIQQQASDHFADVWRHLKSDAQRALFLLAQGEMQQDGKRPAILSLDNVTLKRLLADGLVETTQDKLYPLYDGKRWRVSAASFANWIVENHKLADSTVPIELTTDGSERLERVKSLRQQLDIRRRNLNVLEEQAGKYGLAVPSHIAIQIEDTRREIQGNLDELKKLGARE